MNEKDFNAPISKTIGSFEVKSVDSEKRTIVAYGSAFGVKDSHGDIVVKGAFKNSIGARILFLNAHDKWDTTNTLGVVSKIEEDDFGLLFEVKIANTTKGNDILELYKEGVPLQHSIGGFYGKGADAVTYDESQGAWLVKSFDLKEISVVPFGSNPQTPLKEIKSEAENMKLKALQDEVKQIKAELQEIKALQPQEPQPQETKTINIQTLKQLLNL